MKIGIFGGTFNPVHNGHVRLAENFKEELNLDKLLIIPTAVPPHKEAENIASGEDRLKMCELAFENIGEVSDIELARGGRSYTVETLESLKEIYTDAEFYFLVGSDMLLCFRRWYRYEDILSMCTLCATDRDNAESCRDADNELFEKIIFCDFPKTVVSSSEVREKLKKKEDILHLVPQKVEKYIKEKGLYNACI